MIGKHVHKDKQNVKIVVTAYTNNMWCSSEIFVYLHYDTAESTGLLSSVFDRVNKHFDRFVFSFRSLYNFIHEARQQTISDNNQLKWKSFIMECLINICSNSKKWSCKSILPWTTTATTISSPKYDQTNVKKWGFLLFRQFAVVVFFSVVFSLFAFLFTLYLQ